MWENNIIKIKYFDFWIFFGLIFQIFNQLQPSNLSRARIIATNVEENKMSKRGVEKIFDLIDELPLLPSSEFFFLIDSNDDNEDVMVKQGAALELL